MACREANYGFISGIQVHGSNSPILNGSRKTQLGNSASGSASSLLVPYVAA